MTATDTRASADLALTDVFARLEAVEQRLAVLEGQATEQPEDCRQHTCTYYAHYLAYGPAELEHEGYHAAERRCTVAQEAVMLHYEHHAEGDRLDACRACRTLEHIAERWEKQVRA